MAQQKIKSITDKTKLKSWYSNRYQIVVVQRNILLVFTIIAMLGVVVAVIFVKNIMSSKSLDPYVIEVEENTGIATVVTQMTTEQFTGNEVMRRYFINEFVHAASGYDPKTYKNDAEKVRLSSTPGVYADFRNRINARELGVDSAIEVRIKSIQYIDNNTAQIRILRQINLADANPTTKDEIITMNFYFNTNLNLTLEERLINPLGFQVSNYKITDEIFNY
jgi:type IV secretion system protein VirB8